MTPVRLTVERLEARLPLADGAAGGLHEPGSSIAGAGELECDLECQRSATLGLLQAEVDKKVAAAADLSQRLVSAGDDVVDSQRLQLWIDGWNQYGSTLSADVAAATNAQVAAELEALQEKYRLTSTGLVALTEMGGGTHLGLTGGLYPGGGNTRPAAVEAAGIEAAGQIVPRRTDGTVDPQNGRIVLVSIGMSNTNQEFGVFVSRANAYSGKNPKVSVINGAQGGRDADDWIDPSATTWTNVDATLAQNGLSPAQVQVAWIKQARAQPRSLGTPIQAINVLRDNLEDISRNLKIRFPNIQIAYVSSRTRAYTDVATSLNPEPYAYESGFAVQQLIAAQIAGQADLNHDPSRGQVMAPLLLWGPYVWADGTNARQDGFAWLPHDLGTDKTHPAASGREKVAYELLRFFTTDATASSWFTTTPPPAGDLNGDGRVSVADVWALQRNLGRSGAATAGRGDLNGDQRIDRADVAILAKHFAEEMAQAEAVLASLSRQASTARRPSLRASRSSPATVKQSLHEPMVLHALRVWSASRQSATSTINWRG